MDGLIASGTQTVFLGVDGQAEEVLVGDGAQASDAVPSGSPAASGEGAEEEDDEAEEQEGREGEAAAGRRGAAGAARRGAGVVRGSDLGLDSLEYVPVPLSKVIHVYTLQGRGTCSGALCNIVDMLECCTPPCRAR